METSVKEIYIEFSMMTLGLKEPTEDILKEAEDYEKSFIVALEGSRNLISDIDGVKTYSSYVF